MNDRFFLDTNILVYAFSKQDQAKRDKARSLVRAAAQEGLGVISWQVVQEFLHAALHKSSIEPQAESLSEYARTVLFPMCQVWPGNELWLTALEIQARTQYRFYDSLIVASALAAGTRILYSEDLQPGRVIGDLLIENPFAP